MMNSKRKSSEKEAMRNMLQGKKTYIVAAVAAIFTLVKYLDYIDEDTYQMLLGLLGAGGMATLAAKTNRIDKKLIFFLILSPLALFSQRLEAQAIPTSKLAWDQVAPDLISAQGYTYKYYPDSNVNGTSLSAVICSGTNSPFSCEVAFPSFTPGNHTLTLSATNIAGESGKSSPFVFTFIVTPGIPSNIRIK